MTFRVKSMFGLSNSFLPILRTFKDFSEEKKFIFYKLSGQIKNRWPLGILYSTTWFFPNFFGTFYSFFAKFVMGICPYGKKRVKNGLFLTSKSPKWRKIMLFDKRIFFLKLWILFFFKACEKGVNHVLFTNHTLCDLKVCRSLTKLFF